MKTLIAIWVISLVLILANCFQSVALHPFWALYGCGCICVAALLWGAVVIDHFDTRTSTGSGKLIHIVPFWGLVVYVFWPVVVPALIILAVLDVTSRKETNYGNS